MKIKILVGALVLLMVVNVAAITAFIVVHHSRGMPPFGPWRAFRGERPLAHLDRDKRSALFGAMREFHRESRDLIDETRALENQAIAAMGEDPVPRAQIDSLLQQISDNRLEIARRATNHMIEMGENLTPAEREHLMAALMHMRAGRAHDALDGPGRLDDE